MILDRLRSSRGPLVLASKLLGSSVLAQVAVLAATAIASTDLHPSDYAIYGAVSGLTWVAASVNTYAAETRSPVVDDDTAAVLNRAGATVLTTSSALMLLVGLVALPVRAALGWTLVLAAGCGFLTGAQQLLTGLVLRHQRQSLLAAGRVSQGLTNAALLLAFWFAGAPGAVVLTVSWLLSLVVGDLVLLRGALSGAGRPHWASRSDLGVLRREVGAQPVANLLASSVANLPSILLPALGQPVLAGVWALVSRFLNPLVNTTYNTLQPLYYGRAAGLVREGEWTRLSQLHQRWLKWLVAGGVPVAAGSIFLSMVLLPLLGPQWRVGWAPAIAGALYYTSVFSCLPMSQTLQMLGRVGLALRWTIVRAVVCLVPLLAVPFVDGPWPLLLWALGAAVTFYWQFWLQRASLPDSSIPGRGLPEENPDRRAEERAGVPETENTTGATTARPQSTAPDHRAGWAPTALLGLGGAALACLGNDRPALWLDEVATLDVATRSWSQLFALLHRVDLVHAPYYVVMHLWTQLAGTSAFALRLPSALFVGLTLAALYRILQRFMTPRLAAFTAVAALCLPRVLWSGSEAREQAMAMAMATLATLALVRAREGSGHGRWALYWLLGVASALSSLFAVLVVVVHGVWAWLERSRAPWKRTAVWAAAVLATIVPWALLAQTQSAQVDWIGSRSAGDLAKQIAVKQFFYGDDKPSGFEHGAPVLGLIVLLALCQAVLAVRLVLRLGKLSRPEQSLALLAGCFVLVPVLCLLAAQLVVPVYVPRYLTWAAPWVAPLVVLGAKNSRWAKALLVLSCVAALALQLPMRQVIDAPHDDYRTVAADMVASQAPNYAYTRGALVGAVTAYPDAFTGRRDLSVQQRGDQIAALFPTLREPSQALRGVSGKVFLMAPGGRHSQQGVLEWHTALDAKGCRKTAANPGDTVTTEVWQC